MRNSLTISRWSSRRSGPLPALQGNQTPAVTVQGGNRTDQGEGQCATVLQIIERVCASHQGYLGCYPFLSWGDFRRQC